MNIESWATQLIMELDEDNLVDTQSHTMFTQETTSHLPTAVAETYYRSKAFTPFIGINRLINAADPLLTFATQFSKVSVQPDFTSLQSHLCHEIRAFENKAQTMGYHMQIIMAARYVLCSLIDELISYSSLGRDWGNYTLINYFHRDQEEIEKDRFFIILERSQQDVATHIDLLELIYICLRFGYEGEYRRIERGHLILSNITDNLYQNIRQQRSEFSKSLLINLDSSSYLHARKTIFRHLLPPFWIVFLVSAVIFILTFTTLHIKLKKFSAPLEQLIATLVQVNASEQPRVMPQMRET